ncbi:Fe(2+) transporter permease subunit FeoB [Desulfothermus naphthae]
MKNITIALIGNPNCGKTTLFNHLTGANLKVGNWPGVTVEKKTGTYLFNGKKVDIVDLPGIYSLSASSLDEKIARDYVLSQEADVIINILDASNLERNLYLTYQLLEMGAPVIIALNMMDIVKDSGISIDIKTISETLKCPVVPIIAKKGEGIDVLKEKIDEMTNNMEKENFQINYNPPIKWAIEKLKCSLPNDVNNINKEWIILKLLEGYDEIISRFKYDLGSELDEVKESIKEKTGMDSDAFVASSRYMAIEDLCKKAIKKPKMIGKTITDTIDSIVLNRYLGIPIFLLAMYITFMFTINVGGSFIDFFDILFGTLFVDGPSHFLENLKTPQWLITILCNGIGGGIQTVATFIPPIGFMFLCLSILEDSGYMARAAFVMDRLMRAIGLPGKAFIPMLVGFGCNVPAIMATRTLENEKDRLLTIAMNPFMSCGARLPVYALFGAAFFGTGSSNLIFLLYLIGILMAILTGILLKNTVLKGEISPFVMELPPYHMPTIKGVLFHTYDRLKVFLIKAGKVIIAIVVVLSFLNSIGTDGTFGHEDSGSSVLAKIGKSITPILHPLGIEKDNWPATVGLFTGIFAKEAVVGTLNSLYGAELKANTETEEESFSLLQGIKDAFASIPENLSGLASTITDPFGIGSAAEEPPEDVEPTALEIMRNHFHGKIGAFAYLLFVLLYIPCLVAVAAIYREANFRWAMFIVIYTVTLAWSVSTIFYQIATFKLHPLMTMIWIVGIGIFFFSCYLLLKIKGTEILGIGDLKREILNECVGCSNRNLCFSYKK